MSKTKIMRPSVDAIAVITRREMMPSTGEYDKVKSTPSRMYDLYANVIQYISYWLPMPVFYPKIHYGSEYLCVGFYQGA